jgi:hypothetical protein
MQKLTPQQQLVWDYLIYDPKQAGDKFGHELLALSCGPKAKFHNKVDEHIRFIMDHTTDPHDVIDIITCWLTKYRLPICATKLKTFDEFHRRYSKYILARVK